MKLFLSENWSKALYCTGTAFQRAHELVCSPDTNSLIKSSLIKSITLGSEREAGGSKLIAILLLVLLLHLLTIMLYLILSASNGAVKFT